VLILWISEFDSYKSLFSTTNMHSMHTDQHFVKFLTPEVSSHIGHNWLKLITLKEVNCYRISFLDSITWNLVSAKKCDLKYLFRRTLLSAARGGRNTGTPPCYVSERHYFVRKICGWWPVLRMWDSVQQARIINTSTAKSIAQCSSWER